MSMSRARTPGIANFLSREKSYSLIDETISDLWRGRVCLKKLRISRLGKFVSFGGAGTQFSGLRYLQPPQYGVNRLYFHQIYSTHQDFTKENSDSLYLS